MHTVHRIVYQARHRTNGYIQSKRVTRASPGPSNPAYPKRRAEILAVRWCIEAVRFWLKENFSLGGGALKQKWRTKRTAACGRARIDLCIEIQLLVLVCVCWWWSRIVGNNYPSKLMEERTTSTSTYVPVYHRSIHPLGGIYVDDVSSNESWVGALLAVVIVGEERRLLRGTHRPGISNGSRTTSPNVQWTRPAALPFGRDYSLTCAFLVCTDHRLSFFSPRSRGRHRCLLRTRQLLDYWSISWTLGGGFFHNKVDCSLHAMIPWTSASVRDCVCGSITS
jgi:hypothetical protein